MKANMINQMKSSLKDYYNNYIKLRESKEISSTMPQIFSNNSNNTSAQVNLNKQFIKTSNT